LCEPMMEEYREDDVFFTNANVARETRLFSPNSQVLARCIYRFVARRFVTS